MGCSQSTVSKTRTGKATDIRRSSSTLTPPSSLSSSGHNGNLNGTKSVRFNLQCDPSESELEEVRVKRKQKILSPLSTTSSQISYNSSDTWKVTSKRKRPKSKEDNPPEKNVGDAKYYLSF
eukprot:TRINITY_DN1517_c2_g1_i1.p1 TRINITY_DN1517_c2_g1~~TRINITY_DN1517_c2_g1_i1.p1  ORF type:complete len:121 (+),score=15.82 TRINITY_DN1517_c2_g1_i1:124-486(+)